MRKSVTIGMALVGVGFYKLSTDEILSATDEQVKTSHVFTCPLSSSELSMGCENNAVLIDEVNGKAVYEYETDMGTHKIIYEFSPNLGWQPTQVGKGQHFIKTDTAAGKAYLRHLKQDIGA